MSEVPSAELFKLIGAGGNVALLVCVWYIVQAVKVLTKLEKGIDALLYRIGFHMDDAGDVERIPKRRKDEQE